MLYLFVFCCCFIFQKGLGDYSFLPFSVLLAGFFVFTFKFVPETKNRTIDDISRTWRTGSSDSKDDKSRTHLENGTKGNDSNNMHMYEQTVDISSENH